MWTFDFCGRSPGENSAAPAQGTVVEAVGYHADHAYIQKQIGRLPDGIDLSNSVENEFYCLRLAAAFGLPVTKAEMQDFNGMRALVVERFDRRWTADKRLLRMPQEDFCQVLSVPPTRKYQSEGGPGLIQMLEVLRGSDSPTVDRETLLKAQIFLAHWGHGRTCEEFQHLSRPRRQLSLDAAL